MTHSDSAPEHKPDQATTQNGGDSDQDPEVLELSTEQLLGAGIDPDALEQITRLLATQQTADADAECPPESQENFFPFSERLEELAEDMLTLMRRIRDLESGQKTILERIDQLAGEHVNPQRNIAREVDSLRRDLIGDRRQSATTELIQELMPLVDRMSCMQETLDSNQDERMIAQVGGVLEALNGCLRRMGAQEFFIESGTAFDQFQMETHEESLTASSRVDITLKPGFRVGQIILRRALVKLAYPQPLEETKDPADE